MIENRQVGEEQSSYFKSLFENDTIYVGVHKEMMKFTKNLPASSHPNHRPMISVPASSDQQRLSLPETSTQLVAHHSGNQSQSNQPSNIRNSVNSDSEDSPPLLMGAPSASEDSSSGNPDAESQEDIIDGREVESEMRGNENNNSQTVGQAT